MIEILSIVYFSDEKRIKYLERSFSSLHHFNQIDRHIVIDGSDTLESQRNYYEKYNIEFHHCPGMTFSKRLKLGLSLLKSDHFIFYNDDYEWIFAYPIKNVIEQMKRYTIPCVKLSAPSFEWYSQQDPNIIEWFDENYVLNNPSIISRHPLKKHIWKLLNFITNHEKLRLEGDMLVSERVFLRNIFQHLSLGAVLNKAFLMEIIHDMPDSYLSGGNIEKYLLKKMLFKKYKVGYYKMLTPMFHFIEPSVEGSDKDHMLKTNLIPENYKYIRSNQ